MLLRSSRVHPNMMDGPWVDKPQAITESELAALESNYESMLKSIREDTFGGQLPPKYNPNQIRNLNRPLSFEFNRDLHGNPLHHHIDTNQSIHVYNDEEDQVMESGLDISFNHSVNDSALSAVPRSGPNRLSHLQFLSNTQSHLDPDRNGLNEQKEEESAIGRRFRNAFESAEINLSVQRVRMQLNMTASPTMSPIRRSTVNDDSVIDVDVDQIAERMERAQTMESQGPSSNAHDLSLPFLSPSVSDHRDTDRRSHSHQRRRRRMQFVAQSTSPPNIPSYGRRAQDEPQSSSARLGPMDRSFSVNASRLGDADDSDYLTGLSNEVLLSLLPSGMPAVPPGPPLPVPFLPPDDHSDSQMRSMLGLHSTSFSRTPSQRQVSGAPSAQAFPMSRGVPDSVTSSMMQQHPLAPDGHESRIGMSGFQPAAAFHSGTFRPSHGHNDESFNFEINHMDQFNASSSNERSMAPPQRNAQRGPPPAPQRNTRHHRTRHRFPRNNMNRNNFFTNLVSDSGSSAMFSSDMQGLSGLVHDGSTDNIESSSSFVMASTPDNAQYRSASASLDAPRRPAAPPRYEANAAPSRRRVSFRQDNGTVDESNPATE